MSRYRALRNWAFGLGLLALASAVVVATLIGAASWDSGSTYSALAGSSFTRWSVQFLLSSACALFFVAALSHGLSKRGHGEV